LPSINISHLSRPNSVQTTVASLFLLRTIVVVITVFIALFPYCIFKIYSAIQLSSRKFVISLSVQGDLLLSMV